MKWTISSAVVKDSYLDLTIALLAEVGDSFQIAACTVSAHVTLPIGAGDVAAAAKAAVIDAFTNQKRAAAQLAAQSAAQTVAATVTGSTASVAV